MRGGSTFQSLGAMTEEGLLSIREERRGGGRKKPDFKRVSFSHLRGF